MRLKPLPVQIPEGDPFKFDALSRRPAAESLIQIIKASEDGLVVALDAAWGQGKTTFLRMLQAQLRNEGNKAIEFNAWESDFNDDALAALIGEVGAGLNSIAQAGDGTESDAMNEKIEKFKKIGGRLIRQSIPGLIKMASAGIIDADEIVETFVAEYGEKIAEQKIKEYEDSKKSIAEFRLSLEFAVCRLSEAKSTSLPIVIVIDELDRCRPIYAVRVLECIKHLFSVNGVFFLIAVDKKQLSHAVKSQYGVGMDADGYLRRFFDVELSLPAPDKRAFSRMQFDRFGLGEFFKVRSSGVNMMHDKDKFSAMLPELFSCMECSLRDQEKAFSILSLALKATPPNYYIYPEIISVLIVLRLKDYQMYSGFIAGVVSSDMVLERIGSGPGGRKFVFSRQGTLLDVLVNAAVLSEHESSALANKYLMLANGSSDSEVKRRAGEAHELCASGYVREAFGCLNYLVSKIDLVSGRGE